MLYVRYAYTQVYLMAKALGPLFPTWKPWEKLLALGFGLAIVVIWRSEWASGQKIDLSLSTPAVPHDYDFQISKYIFKKKVYGGNGMKRCLY